MPHASDDGRYTTCRSAPASWDGPKRCFVSRKIVRIGRDAAGRWRFLGVLLFAAALPRKTRTKDSALKTFTAFVVLSFSLLLSACGGSDLASGASKMSSSDYLLHNISVWNGVVKIVDPWVSGERGQSLMADAIAHKPLEQYKIALAGQRKALAANTQANTMMASGVPDNAKELDAKLVATLKSADATMAAMEQIAALPDGYTNETLAPLGKQLQTTANGLVADIQALNTAQRAYSKEHNVPFQEVQQ